MHSIPSHSRASSSSGMPPTRTRAVSSTTSSFFFPGVTIKIGFYFFTYECCRRRLSLIKVINRVKEVLILLFTAFGYEYLFWSVVVRAWIVRLVIRKKIRFVSKRQTTKRSRRSNQKYLARKMFQQKYLGFVKFQVWEYPFRTKAVLRQYYQFLRSKYIPVQTTSGQLSDNFEDIFLKNLFSKNGK